MDIYIKHKQLFSWLAGLVVRSSMRRTAYIWEMPSCPSTQPSLICWVAALLRCMWVEQFFTPWISLKPPGTSGVVDQQWLVSYSMSYMFISTADPSRQGWSSKNQGHPEVSGAHRGPGGSHQLACANSRLRQRLDMKLESCNVQYLGIF